jgi:hypothetical protein
MLLSVTLHERFLYHTIINKNFTTKYAGKHMAFEQELLEFPSRMSDFAIIGVSAHAQKINQIIYMGWAQEPLEVIRSRKRSVEKILADTDTGLRHVSIQCQKY